MGYTVVFYKAGEKGLEFWREAFIERTTAQKWVKLIRRNGYELHSIVREPIRRGARV